MREVVLWALALSLGACSLALGVEAHTAVLSAGLGGWGLCLSRIEAREAVYAAIGSMLVAILLDAYTPMTAYPIILYLEER